MGDAVEIIEQLLDRRLPSRLQIDEATALVDPHWRENMRARFQAQADLDLSKPRPPARGALRFAPVASAGSGDATEHVPSAWRVGRGEPAEPKLAFGPRVP